MASASAAIQLSPRGRNSLGISRSSTSAAKLSNSVVLKPESKFAEPKFHDETKFVEAVCNAFAAPTTGVHPPYAQDEIANLREGFASLADRCHEILNLTKEMARELQAERDERKVAIEEVREQTRKTCDNLERRFLQQQCEHNARVDLNLESVQRATDAAREELSNARDHMLMASEAGVHRVGIDEAESIQLSSETCAFAQVAVNSMDALTSNMNQEPECRHTAAMQDMRKSWQEEATNIRSHIKRFQDTFSKSLSFEREARQQDIRMLMDRRPNSLSEASKQFLGNAVPLSPTEHGRRPDMSVAPPSDTSAALDGDVALP